MEDVPERAEKRYWSCFRFLQSELLFKTYSYTLCVLCCLQAVSSFKPFRQTMLHMGFTKERFHSILCCTSVVHYF